MASPEDAVLQLDECESLELRLYLRSKVGQIALSVL